MLSHVGSQPHHTQPSVSCEILAASHMTVSLMRDPSCITHNLQSHVRSQLYHTQPSVSCEIPATPHSILSHVRSQLYHIQCCLMWDPSHITHDLQSHVRSQLYHTQPLISCYVAGIPTHVIRPHTPLNHLGVS